MRYGAFWHAGKRWLAQHWAAIFIHQLDLEGKMVIQTCDDPLCVEHLAVADKPTKDLALHWTLVQKGVREPEPEKPRLKSDIPFYSEPGWLRTILRAESEANDEVPF